MRICQRSNKKWTGQFINIVSEATQGSAMSVMGVLVSGDSDQSPKRIERQEGEIAKFTTSVTPQSTGWLVISLVVTSGLTSA